MSEQPRQLAWWAQARRPASAYDSEERYYAFHPADEPRLPALPYAPRASDPRGPVLPRDEAVYFTRARDEDTKSDPDVSGDDGGDDDDVDDATPSATHALSMSISMPMLEYRGLCDRICAASVSGPVPRDLAFRSDCTRAVQSSCTDDPALHQFAFVYASIIVPANYTNDMVRHIARLVIFVVSMQSNGRFVRSSVLVRICMRVLLSARRFHLDYDDEDGHGVSFSAQYGDLFSTMVNMLLLRSSSESCEARLAEHLVRAARVLMKGPYREKYGTRASSIARVKKLVQCACARFMFHGAHLQWYFRPFVSVETIQRIRGHMRVQIENGGEEYYTLDDRRSGTTARDWRSVVHDGYHECVPRDWMWALRKNTGRE